MNCEERDAKEKRFDAFLYTVYQDVSKHPKLNSRVLLNDINEVIGSNRFVMEFIGEGERYGLSIAVPYDRTQRIIHALPMKFLPGEILSNRCDLFILNDSFEDMEDGIYATCSSELVDDIIRFVDFLASPEFDASLTKFVGPDY